MSLQRCQIETTSSEFVDWCYYLQYIEPNQHGKLEHGLAKIAAEVHRTRVKKPNKVTEEEKLIKFKIPETKTNQMSYEDRLARSKAFWSAGIGINIK